MHRKNIVLFCSGISILSLLLVCSASLVMDTAIGNFLEMDPLRPRFLYSPPSNLCGPPGKEFNCPRHHVCVSPEG